MINCASILQRYMGIRLPFSSNYSQQFGRQFGIFQQQLTKCIEAVKNFLVVVWQVVRLTELVFLFNGKSSLDKKPSEMIRLWGLISAEIFHLYKRLSRIGMALINRWVKGDRHRIDRFATVRLTILSTELLSVDGFLNRIKYIDSMRNKNEDNLLVIHSPTRKI